MFYSDGKKSDDLTGDVEEILVAVDDMRRHCQVVTSQHESTGVVLVVGNTGAGKSTFINYMAGCAMEAKATGGCMGDIKVLDPVAGVGVGFSSRTFYPQLVSLGGAPPVTYCDFAGFLDSRGPKVDIITGYSINAILEAVPTIKGIVLMINFHSLCADRGRNLDAVLDHLTQLFGGRADLKRPYGDSIQVIFTHCPVNNARFNTKRLVDNFRKYLPENWGFLADRVCWYDPLDREAAIKNGAMDRDQMVVLVNQLSPITDKNDFHWTISARSSVYLHEFANRVMDAIRLQFQIENFSQVNRLINALDSLLVLNSEIISNAVLRMMVNLLGIVKGFESRDDAIGILECVRDEIPGCREMANASIAVIQARLTLRTQEEKAIADARYATKEAKKIAEGARAEIAEIVVQRESVETATLESEQLAQSYVRLIDRLKMQIENERCAAAASTMPHVIHAGGGGSAQGSGFKKLLGGLVSGVFTGIATGNPMLGFTTGARATAQSMLGMPIPMPMPMDMSTSISAETPVEAVPTLPANTQGDESATASWAAGLFKDAVTGGIAGGVSGLPGGPLGILANAGLGAAGNVAAKQVAKLF